MKKALSRWHSYVLPVPISLKPIICVAVALSLSIAGISQDSLSNKYQHLQEQYIATVNKKAAVFNADVQKYTDKMLDRVISQEKRMQRKIARVDSLKAKALFAYSIDSLQKFKAAINNKISRIRKFLPGKYFAYLDTLQQSLGYMNKTKGAMDAAGNMQAGMDASLRSVDQATSGLATTEEIGQFLQQREAVLRSQLSVFPGLASNISAINKQSVYYRGQIAEYKNTLQDEDKMERLALQVLEKSGAFQRFMEQNGQLSGLFTPASSFPGLGSTIGGTTPVVNGLPSRAALQQFIQGQMPGTTGQDITQIVQAQADKIGGAAGNSLDALGAGVPRQGTVGDNNAAVPDFTPNSQHTKSFRKRLEFGANLQFGPSTNYLPATCDFGLQAGYKIDDRSTFGIGLSYAMGLGSGWNHIRFSNNSIGFRNYVKWKPKKGKDLYLQGGAELNYLTAFSGIAQLRNFNAWQSSALFGIGKTYKIRNKLSGDIVLLYDVLYNNHTPATRPLLLRLGYNF